MKKGFSVLAAAVCLTMVMAATPVSAQGRHGGGGHGHMGGGEVHHGYVHGYGGFHGHAFYGPGYGFYDPFWFGFGWAPWGAYVGPGYYGPYGGGYHGEVTGALKLKVNGVDPKVAKVSVNGGYVGTVDDFNGTFQQLDLRPGDYRVEVSAPGFQTLTFNVQIDPGRTITYRGVLQPGQ
jgi:hypothetical protein